MSWCRYDSPTYEKDDVEMMCRTGLSEKGMSKLVAWCEEVLKSKYDPTTFAENFDVDYEHYTCYEIRGWHTKSGNPETFTLEDDSDFIMGGY